MNAWHSMLKQKADDLACLLSTRWLRRPPLGKASGIGHHPGAGVDRAGYRSPAAAQSETPVFITARFRSGSTYLWNLFHSLGTCTAYYEPLHERRWFESANREAWIDPTHRQVTASYHTNYEGLESLSKLYDERWNHRRLYMNARAVDRKLRAYIQSLIDHATLRPVLQFNRVDFRLGWLRSQFPHARLLHLYRSPREQWISSLKDSSPPGDITLGEFQPFDFFFLMPWWHDLRYVFEGLQECRTAHPYRAFYLLWRLSYLMGRHYADVSIAYENLAQDPRRVMGDALTGMGLPEHLDWSRLEGLTEYRAQQRWPEFASSDWFEDIEGQCEEIVDRMLRR